MAWVDAVPSLHFRMFLLGCEKRQPKLGRYSGFHATQLIKVAHCHAVIKI